MSKTQQAAADSVVVEEQEHGLLDNIINKSHLAASDAEKTRARDIIGELVEQIMEGTVTVDKDIVASIDARVAQLDKLLSDQLSAVMHAPEFQQLESTWQGLRFLIDNTETSSTLKINVLNARKEELHKDFKMSPDFDQSTLFKKVYEDEYGTFGGSPYSALIGDYEVSRNPEDMYFLEEMSHVAAAAHAPFISSASPLLFGLEDFTKMGMPRDLSKLFDTVEYNKWRTFRDSDDARYVGLTLPRVAGRLPYGKEGTKIESFDFEEDVDGTDHTKYLWMNAAYAFASRLTEAFSEFGWTAAIRGVEGGGLVKSLPTHVFKTEDGESAIKCPTEVTITDRRERELSNLGFIPIVHCKNTDYAAFFGANSVQKPAVYNTDAANANAQLSCQLQYIFATSRIAHYLKAIMRDKVGSFGSRQNIEQYLNDWLSQYVLLDDAASPEAKSRFPLREARAEVVEVPGKPGVYKAVAFLRPHYQLDELTLSLRLVAELPQPAGGS